MRFLYIFGNVSRTNQAPRAKERASAAAAADAVELCCSDGNRYRFCVVRACSRCSTSVYKNNRQLVVRVESGRCAQVCTRGRRGDGRAVDLDLETPAEQRTFHQLTITWRTTEPTWLEKDDFVVAHISTG